MEFIASAAFGLEGLVKKELEGLGITARAEQGGARFEADLSAAFSANLWLACSDRVLMVIGEKKVESFEELFSFVSSLPWGDYLPGDAAFPVSGNCVRSRLMSVSDCQSIAKKAIVERLKKKYRVSWFDENGSTHAIHVGIHRDLCRVTMDTSGEALNKRGYRTWVGEAPIRETLAAALVRMAPWKPGGFFYDPCCGTGTLLIEAAFLHSKRAPGLSRAFAMENWKMTDRAACARLRVEAESRFVNKGELPVMGSDIDPEALALCEKHIRQAGLQGRIRAGMKNARDVRLNQPEVCFVTNPPYGERLGDKKKAAQVAAALSELLSAHPRASLSAITADPGFESQIRRRAAKRRRLYNGRLECEFLTFYNEP